MDRRDFLGGTLGLGAAAVPALAQALAARPRIGIIGGGIIGAAIAVQLVDAGADVVVFEKAEPASGATRASLAWINPSTVDRHYRDLRLQSVQAWRRLDARLGLGVVWGGSVSWTDNDAKAKDLQRREDVLKETDAAPRHLAEDDIRALCPYLAPGATQAGFFLPQDGHIDPVEVTRKLVAYAQGQGARFIHPCPVESLILADGAVKGVRTGQGDFLLDGVVSAAGCDSPAIMAMAGFDLKLRNAPGLKIHTQPIAPVTRMVFDFSSALEFKQMPNGEAVAIYVGGPPPLPVHEPVMAAALKAYPSEELAAAHAQSLLGKVARYWPGVKGAGIKSITVGFRPMPMDGLPIVGHVPGAQGLYLVATHSGVTLAPILGEYVAREVLGKNERVGMLARYRPERFLPRTAAPGSVPEPAPARAG